MCIDNAQHQTKNSTYRGDPFFPPRTRALLYSLFRLFSQRRRKKERKKSILSHAVCLHLMIESNSIATRWSGGTILNVNEWHRFQFVVQTSIEQERGTHNIRFYDISIDSIITLPPPPYHPTPTFATVRRMLRLMMILSAALLPLLILARRCKIHIVFIIAHITSFDCNHCT